MNKFRDYSPVVDLELGTSKDATLLDITQSKDENRAQAVAKLTLEGTDSLEEVQLSQPNSPISVRHERELSQLLHGDLDKNRNLLLPDASKMIPDEGQPQSPDEDIER